MSRYAAAWDSKDAERHVALFTEDATAQIIYEGSVLSETSSNKERMERTLNRLSEFTASGISTRHILRKWSGRENYWGDLFLRCVNFKRKGRAHTKVFWCIQRHVH